MDTPRGPVIEIKTQSTNGRRLFLRMAKDWKITVAVLAVSLAVVVPHGAQAFSFFNDIFGITPAEAVSGVRSYHIPTASTPVLAAARNLNPSGRGGGDIVIVGGVALVSESGPEGTSADVAIKRPESDQISTYVVREGDTLSQIAELFNVSINTIVWANDLYRGNIIRPGETLAILPVSGIKHTVVKGETLASIVKKYKGEMSEVLEFNNLKEGAVLAVGDAVVIPYGIEPQTATVSTSQVARGAGGPLISGYFLRPIIGGVKTQGIHGYNGVDLGASCGTNVLASASGQVILSRFSGWNGGYGSYIVVKHPNGTQTLYAHLSQNYVSAGANVIQGQVIGAVGSTGRSTGCHLHFEVRGAANSF